MPKPKNYIALDVGEKRIGVAIGDDAIRIAIPLDTIEVDGDEIEAVLEIIANENASAVIVGYPRNQSGESTLQTQFAIDFADKLKCVTADIVFQDESLTSVMAKQRLESYNRPYSKADVDAQAATIILQDYLERLP